MIKRRALLRNRIALFLAGMLIFCAFVTDNVLACNRAHESFGHSPITVLKHPGAGEFFTNSLPQGERQSVREITADWQSIMAVRSGRFVGSKNGPRGTDIFVCNPDGLQRLTVCGENPCECSGRSITQCMEVIVCYIHNQDGQKG